MEKGEPADRSGTRAAICFATAIAASLLCVACQPQGAESTNLVGADRLPPSAALSRETIQINRGYGPVGTGFLSYELHPDDSLTVTHSDKRRDKVLGKESFRLASGNADAARRRLLRLRPAKLEGLDAHEARPSGCERQGPHDFGELAVIFVSEDGGPGVEDDRIGVFELPDPQSCSTPQAREARQLVRQVMDLFPPSKVAAGFESQR